MAIPVNHDDLHIDKRGHKLRRMRFERRVELRKRYVASMPLWRHPTLGYLIALLTVGGTAYGLHFMTNALGQSLYFSGSLMMLLPILFVSLFWGIGPALFTLLLCTLVLVYMAIPNAGQFDLAHWQNSVQANWQRLMQLENWQNVVQLLSFVGVGLIIAVLIGQRERARLHVLSAEQELQSYAQHLEEVNQKLEDANQAKDRFISIASHELKTPITTIRGQAQLALRRLLKQAEQTEEVKSTQQALEKINDQTRRLTLLIDDLLDASSIRTGKIELYKKKSDLKEICQEVVEDQRLLSGRAIKLDMPETPVEIAVDRDRLPQVVVNLISNALKYSPENSPVEVSVSKDQRHAFMQVRDHGKGIAPDQQERIFETFYRTPEAESSAKRGLGLGLAISKEIVERHGGRIWCESRPGNGSTFIVELPLK